MKEIFYVVRICDFNGCLFYADTHHSDDVLLSNSFAGASYFKNEKDAIDVVKEICCNNNDSFCKKYNKESIEICAVEIRPMKINVNKLMKRK